MSFVGKRSNFHPKTGEALFQPGEVFFSRTDKRGVIQSADFAFNRIAGYTHDEMVGAPYNIIRDPDTPSGVFQLLWDTIERNECIAVYLKNRGKDGLYYWGLVIVLPIEDGYLSICIKPDSDLLAAVQEKYKSMRQAEQNEGITPAQSAKILLEWVKKIGFSDYLAFCGEAVARELVCGNEALDKPVDPDIVIFSEMIKSAKDLHKGTAALSDGFGSISTIPTNMRVIAARLEPSGGALSALAQNYWSMSEEMSAWFRQFVSATDGDFVKMRHTLDGCRFWHCAARFLTDATATFNRGKRAPEQSDMLPEKQLMDKLAAKYITESKKKLQTVAHESQRISKAVRVMRRFTLGLNSTRVMCNIERARLSGGSEGLTSIISQLDDFQISIEKQLVKIEQLSDIIGSGAATLKSR